MSEKEFRLLDFLTWTVSVSRHEEYRSKKEASLNGGKATANIVFELLTAPPANYPPELVEQWVTKCEKYLPDEEDVRIANGAIQFVRQMSVEKMKGRFKQNVQNLIAYGKVSRQTAGLAASILDVYDKYASERQERYDRRFTRKDLRRSK